MSKVGKYALAKGTARVPELLFSMGTVIYCACVFPKIQSKFPESVLPYLLIGQLKIRELTPVPSELLSMGKGIIIIISKYLSRSNRI